MGTHPIFESDFDCLTEIGDNKMVLPLVAAAAAWFGPQAILSAIGFTGAGIGAGSIAAAIQGVLYGGATTGVFSALQAAGAAGVGVALKASAAAIAGSVAYGSSTTDAEKQLKNDLRTLNRCRQAGYNVEEIDFLTEFIYSSTKKSTRTTKRVSIDSTR